MYLLQVATIHVSGLLLHFAEVSKMAGIKKRQLPLSQITNVHLLIPNPNHIKYEKTKIDARLTA